MPQKKKATTKKGLKKSVNSLWKALQDEKAKHVKASTIIGYMKNDLGMARVIIDNNIEVIAKLNTKLELMTNREKHASEVTARLIKNLA